MCVVEAEPPDELSALAYVHTCIHTYTCRMRYTRVCTLTYNHMHTNIIIHPAHTFAKKPIHICLSLCVCAINTHTTAIAWCVIV